MNQNQKNKDHFQYLKAIYEAPSEDFGPISRKEDWDSIEAAMKTIRIKNIPFKNKALRWGISAAAVIILAIGTTFIMSIQQNNFTIKGTSDIPVAYVLPDGSEVFLSKGSRVSFTKSFNQELREISIVGDAFFSVTSDPDRPFIVKTGEAKIRVTGTSFHVSAPARNKDVEVLVRSGKVLFYNSETFSENSFKVGLYPGDKGIYSSKLKQLNKTHDKQYKQLSWN